MNAFYGVYGQDEAVEHPEVTYSTDTTDVIPGAVEGAEEVIPQTVPYTLESGETIDILTEFATMPAEDIEALYALEQEMDAAEAAAVVVEADVAGDLAVVTEDATVPVEVIETSVTPAFVPGYYEPGTAWIVGPTVPAQYTQVSQQQRTRQRAQQQRPPGRQRTREGGMLEGWFGLLLAAGLGVTVAAVLSRMAK